MAELVVMRPGLRTALCATLVWILLVPSDGGVGVRERPRREPDASPQLPERLPPAAARGTTIGLRATVEPPTETGSEPTAEPTAAPTAEPTADPAPTPGQTPTPPPTSPPAPAPLPTPLPAAAILSRADVRAVQPFAIVPFRLAGYTIRTLDWKALPYNSLGLLSLHKPARSDANGVPYKRIDGHVYYHPGNLASQGCRYVDAYVRTGDGAYLDRAVVRAETLMRIAVRDHGALYFPYRWNYWSEGLRAPWYSAYAQGLALSLFVRLYRVTGDDAYLAMARGTFVSFRRLGPGRTRWVAYVTGHWLWLEEYPSRRPSHVLNGFNFALFGIYDYERLTRDRAARQMLRGALTTMRGNATRYRVPGSVSYYDLVHFTRSLHYHRIHVWQLRMLTRISGSTWFGRLAARLAADVR